MQYASCYEHFQCARLSVPLNWNWTQAEKQTGSRVAIALIKLPAKVLVTHSQYGGPVIVNPGGPGGSGTSQVLLDGKNLQTILDSLVDPRDTMEPANGKYFDILSFDPRGVNNTTPGLHYFPDVASQERWRLTYPDFGILWDSEGMVGMEMARAIALGVSCSQGLDGEGILRYVNTAQVVEDMVEIIEKEGYWRAEEAARLITLEDQRASSSASRLDNGKLHSRIIYNDFVREVRDKLQNLTTSSKDMREAFGRQNKTNLPENCRPHMRCNEMPMQSAKKTAYHPGQEKLQYWGMS